jgi:hypothetical protein
MEVQMQTAELEGAQLDRWVAKAEGLDVKYSTTEQYWRIDDNPDNIHWAPHADWSQAGPIIERESISLLAPKMGHLWEASYGDTVETQALCNGKTPLEAAMRVFVSIRLGAEVPD